MAFIRHCIECRKCSTRYLIAFSPYSNGSYLWRTSLFYLEEYVLYCCCQQPPVFNNCTENDLRTYVVSKAAHERGYGTPEEIVAIEELRKTNQRANRT